MVGVFTFRRIFSITINTCSNINSAKVRRVTVQLVSGCNRGSVSRTSPYLAVYILSKSRALISTFKRFRSTSSSAVYSPIFTFIPIFKRKKSVKDFVRFSLFGNNPTGIVVVFKSALIYIAFRGCGFGDVFITIIINIIIISGKRICSQIQISIIHFYNCVSVTFLIKV